MKGKRTRFYVGLFVVLLLALGLALTVWLGAKRYFRKSYTYEALFSESVQGLSKDTNVQYMGVDVGRVTTIRIAPDIRHIEVVMDLYRKDIVKENIVAELTSSGFTGTSYINLRPEKPDEKITPPKVSFKPQYPVIAAKGSQMSELMAGAGDVVKSVKEIDFKGISNQVKTASHKIEQLAANPELEQIINNVNSTTAKLDRTSSKIERIVDKGDLENVLVSARKTLNEAHDLLNKASTELDKMNLSQTAEQTNTFIKGLERRSASVAVDIRATSENLRLASEHLNLLLQSLKNNPSELILGKPLPPRNGE